MFASIGVSFDADCQIVFEFAVEIILGQLMNFLAGQSGNFLIGLVQILQREITHENDDTPIDAHWHGMYEVAERFYIELIPQAQEIAKHAAENGKRQQAEVVIGVIDEILARPEHKWKNAAKPAK